MVRMGFYQNRRGKSERQQNRQGWWRWAGVIVLSALVGSGATLAAVPLVSHQNSALAALSPTGSANVSAGTNVNVNVTDAVTKVAKKIEPDVVAVVNYTLASNYFGQSSKLQKSDIGSGVYFYNSGQSAYIVTNNHVVMGGKKVEIVLNSGKHVTAKVVGTDPFTDLAVLKVPVSNFHGTQPVQFANSNSIEVGEPAVAIGTPMGLNFADSVTSGIVSGKQRMMPVELPNSSQALDYQPVIQTDAAINPGNSGGPLLNINGQVMGINSSKIVATGFQGMGFAIPANEVQTIAHEIIKNGYAVHPALGVKAASLTTLPQYMWPNVPVTYGVYVAGVTSHNAQAAGLKKGDVIVAMNGQTIQSIADLRTALFQMKPGQKVSLTIYRGTQKKVLHVVIGKETTAGLG